MTRDRLNDSEHLDDAIDDLLAARPVPTPPLPKQRPSQAQRAASLAMRREFQAEMDRVVRDAEKQLRAKTGSKYASLQYHHGGHATIKAMAGASKGYDSVIRRILSVTGAQESQTEIRAAVAQLHPDIAITKNWQIPLPPWARNKWGKLLANYAPPFNSLALTPSTTLAGLHKQARSAVAKLAGEERTFKATIAVTKDHVSINGLACRISTGRSKTKEYRLVRFNLDKLLAALDP